jgi:hypothetical protein
LTTQFAPIYQHAKRPDWGYCAVVEIHDDRTVFKFVDGLNRTIRNDHIQLMQLVDLDEPEATEVRKRIAKHSAPRSTAGGRAKEKKPAAKKAPRVVEAVATAEPEEDA